MIAGLPMYDRPETVGANDRLWGLVRDALLERSIAAPERLTRDMDVWKLWQHPNLVLAQACGLPYRTRLHGEVELVATPVHDLPCEPGCYFSQIIVRADDPRSDPKEFNGTTLAINDRCSQSGWAAPMEWARLHDIGFGNTLHTGSHDASSHAVAEGRADMAAIDAVTWRMAERWDVHVASLRVLAHTAATPALPYISAKGRDSDLVSEVLRAAVTGLGQGDRDILGLEDTIRFSWQRYFVH